MATREELIKALRAADAAGAEDDARRLAAMLQNMTGNETAPEPPSYADQVQSEFDAMPWYQQAGTAAGDIIRQAGHGASLGLTTKLAESLGMEDARQNVEDARIRSGSAGATAELGASMLPLMALPELAPAVAAQNPVIRGGAKAAIGALEGAAVGGVEAGAGNEDVVDGQIGGAISGILGQGAASAIKRGVNAVTAPFRRSQRTTVPELRAQKNAAYDRLGVLDARYRPEAVQSMLGGMDDVITNMRANPTRHPDVFSGRKNVRGMAKAEGDTPYEVDQMRQVLRRDVVKSDDDASATIGKGMLNSMDEFTSNLDPRMVRGKASPEEISEMVSNTHQLNSRYQKLKDVDERLARAERQSLKSLATGEDATIKNNIEGILSNPARREGFTPDEIGQMEKVVKGTPGERFLRQVGRIAPGGGLSYHAATAAGALGYGLGGPLGALAAAAPAVVGQGAKKLGERQTRKNAEELVDLIASGGNASKLRKNATVDERSANALARLFMLGGIKDQ